MVTSFLCLYNRKLSSIITFSIPAGCVVGVEVGSDGALSVEIPKSATGLGFSLDGGKASPHGDRPLYIKRVFRGKLLTLHFCPPGGSKERVKRKEHVIATIPLGLSVMTYEHACFM